MRLSTPTAVSAVALAAVAVLGAQYAGAAPSSVTPQHNATGPGAVASVQGPALQRPAAAQPNIAYLYSTDINSGSGEVYFSIPNPPSGIYTASFTANFNPTGSQNDPTDFTCAILKNGALRTQSTISTTQSTGFYAGVNGSNSVKVSSGDDFEIICGTADDSQWDFGSRPVQVSMTRIDGLTDVQLGQAQQKAGGSSALAPR